MAKSGSKRRSGNGGAKTSRDTRHPLPKDPPATTGSAAPTSTASGWALMSVPQRVAWACLHAMVLLVPIAISNWTWIPGVEVPFTFDQFDTVKVFLLRALTLVAVCAWVWHVVLYGGTVRRTKVDLLILALLAWFTLASVLSIHPETAILGKYRRYEGLLSFITYAAVFFLAVQYLDRLSRVRSIARTLFFSGLVVNGYGVLQYLGVDPLTWGTLPFEARRSFSTFGNPDLLSGFVIIAMAVSLALALSERDTRWRSAYWIGFLLAAVCLVTAFTRGAWVGGVVALIALLIAIVMVRGTKLRVVDWSFIGASGLGAGTVVALSLDSPDPVMNVATRLVSIFEFDQGSALTRFQIWDAAWRATLDRPWFGFGPDTFRLIFPGYKPFEYAQAAGYLSVADNAHNYFLQLSSSVGIPGMLLLYGLFVAVAVLSARHAFTRPASEKDNARLVLAGMWAASAGYIVKLMFGLSVTGVTFLLWVAMAALMAPRARTVEVQPMRSGAYVAAVITMVALIASWANLMFLMADNAYLRAKLEPTYERRVAAAELAVSRNPFNDMYRTEVAVVHADRFSALARAIMDARQAGNDATHLLPEAERTFRLAERAFLDVISFVGHEYDNYVFLAHLYNHAGVTISPEYFNRAIYIARRGIQVSEYGPAVRLQYAIALVNLGRLDEAERQMLETIPMDSNFAEPFLLLGDIHMQRGEWGPAAEMYERVRLLQPHFPGIEDSIEQARRSMAEAGTGASE